MCGKGVKNLSEPLLGREKAPGHDERRGPGGEQSPSPSRTTGSDGYLAALQKYQSSATQVRRMFWGRTPQTFFPISVNE